MFEKAHPALTVDFTAISWSDDGLARLVLKVLRTEVKSPTTVRELSKKVVI